MKDRKDTAELHPPAVRGGSNLERGKLPGPAGGQVVK